MATGFRVKLSLRAQLIPGRRLTLDGLLAGILYQRYLAAGDPDAGNRATREVPLTRIDGVSQASQALPDRLRWPVMMTVGVVQSVARDINHPQIGTRLTGLPRNRFADRSGYLPADRNIQAGAGDYRNLTNYYSAIDTAAITFLGHGDFDAVMELLRVPPSIGALRTKGYGALGEVEGEVVPARPLFAIVGAGTLLRPVPYAWRAQLPEGVECRRAEETWCNPYRSPEREDCLIPPFGEADSFTAEEIAAFTVE